MTTDTLKIVKEDILRILGEEKEKITAESIKSEVNASDLYISKAFEELERGGLINHNKFISLTEKGEENAKDIVKKHLIIENYFRETKNEGNAHKAAHILEHYISKEVIDNLKKLSTFKNEGIPLADLEIDKEGMISDIVFPDHGAFERVVSMGMFPGEKIRIVNKIPDGIIVKIKNKKIALNRDLAKKIKVIKKN